jgi:hypothetical protein
LHPAVVPASCADAAALTGADGLREAGATGSLSLSLNTLLHRYLSVPSSSPHAFTPTLTFVRQAKALQASLMEIVDRVEIVKSEHEKLEGGNKFLQS